MRIADTHGSCGQQVLHTKIRYAMTAQPGGPQRNGAHETREYRLPCGRASNPIQCTDTGGIDDAQHTGILANAIIPFGWLNVGHDAGCELEEDHVRPFRAELT